MATEHSPEPKAPKQIANVMNETRVFPPSSEFSQNADIGSMDAYQALYDASIADTEKFWEAQAREHLHWFTPFTQTLDWQEPLAQWFIGGKTNVSYNCLDAHVQAGRGDRVAFHWEGEPGDTRTITYAELTKDVCRFAAALTKLGIEKGDRVSIYMPMVPELPVAMLACARIGAIHSVIFGGFSAEAIADRNNDAQAKLVITADGGWRRGKLLSLKQTVDDALAKSPSVEHCIVLRRAGNEPTMQAHRDLWWHEITADSPDHFPAVEVDSEDPLFILYTSGSTGKPKGIKHTTAGYNLYAKRTFEWVFDHKPGQDIFWCTADCGWITGHSYIVYGPLSAGATQVLYEGAPNWPAEDRFWELIEKYKVTILYTAPTAIRAFIKWGDHHVDKHDLSSLRLLGSVGEGINPEAWMWYYNKIGSGRCPIVDTWWQTETGGQMISPLPGVTTLKPGSACFALPGIGVEVVDEEGHPIERGGGYLTLTRPWPAMLRGIWGAPERYKDTYWSRYPGRYFAGDGAKIDDDGYIWLLGRVDDVMNVSGHRISTTEVESALVDHTSVAEAAVVGATDDLTGQAIVGYVILRGGITADDALVHELRAHVATKIGPTARPKRVIIVPDLPKTRSGKIMRRLLRDIADGNTLGDTTTLADPSVVDAIRESALHGPGSGK